MNEKRIYKNALKVREVNGMASIIGYGLGNKVSMINETPLDFPALEFKFSTIMTMPIMNYPPGMINLIQMTYGWYNWKLAQHSRAGKIYFASTEVSRAPNKGRVQCVGWTGCHPLIRNPAHLSRLCQCLRSWQLLTASSNRLSRWKLFNSW